MFTAQFVHGDFARDGNRFEARKRLQHSDGTYFGVENDDVYEGPEGLVVSIERDFVSCHPVSCSSRRPNGDYVRVACLVHRTWNTR